jgi:hypothetical protein
MRYIKSRFAIGGLGLLLIGGWLLGAHLLAHKPSPVQISNTTPIIAPLKPLAFPVSIKASQLTALKLPSGNISGTADGQALGIAAGSSLTSLSTSALADRIQAIANSGASWIRFDFDWSIIQPDNQQSYQWGIYDNIVADSVKDHLQVLGILDYTPSWARSANCGDSKCAPADDSQFANFAAAAANRYKGQGVHDWEVWNEPNNPGFWQPSPNPAAYAQLLKSTYASLHTADAQAYVISGGLSPQATTSNSYSPVDFLTALYSNGGAGSFDAVADHPYTFPLTPANQADDAWTQMAAASNSLRSLMVANGDASKKIWITEFGAPTGGPGPISTISNPNLSAQPYVVDEGLQAKDLTDALNLYRTYSWAGPFFYYSYQDAGTSQDTNENFFGLVRADGSQKPAYSVFQIASQSFK